MTFTVACDAPGPKQWGPVNEGLVGANVAAGIAEVELMALK